MRTWFDRLTGAMDPDFLGVRFPEPDLFSPSELYHEVSKLFRATGSEMGVRVDMFLGNQRIQEAAANPFKSYSGYPVIHLPEPQETSCPLGVALERRRSVRDYSPDRLIDIQTLANWIGWGCGLRWRDITEEGRPGRTYPSGGGLYPLEVYLCVRRAAGLPPGLYHYNVSQHSLEVLKDESVVDRVFGAMTQEDATNSAHIAILSTAVFMRSYFKYGERSYRFVLLEAGHMMQNLHLLAAAFDVGMVALGGFYDDVLHDALGVNGVDEAIVHAAVIGPLSAG